MAPGLHTVGSEPDPLLGRVINDRYMIVEQIGHGGMGRVYKALQVPLERLVALKVLGAGHDRDPNFYKRFFLEASVTAKLTHPNTITLYDYGRTDDGIFFIAMEYLNGRTLSAAMQQDGPLAQERVVHIAQQICRSLREAHAMGIIHRDLKPANVMLLLQHDDHDFVKVLDFGLVKFFQGDNAEGDITNAGTFMGSPHYIAPEQARNQSPDQRCDIYSLGVLLYHMLTGKVPFTAPAPVDIILKHLHEPPVSLREARPDLNLSPELEEIVLRCMAKAREKRFQSMDEMLAALKSVRSKITGVSGPNSTPPRSVDDTAPQLRPASAALSAPTPQPGMRTPSQPMNALRTPSAGMPHVGRPPPAPRDAYDMPPRRAQTVRMPRAPPQFAAPAEQKKPRVRVPIIAAASLGIAAVAAGGGFYLRSTTPAAAPQSAAPAVAVPAVRPAAAAAQPVSDTPVPPASDTPVRPAGSYSTANAETTLVTITSLPSGAEVRDEDARLLGVTPFDLRVPTARQLQLTLKHEGYKPLTLKKTPEGERMPLSVTLKKDRKAAPSDQMPNKRSVGYKDDPY
jgi:serine/threonine-protein kinase